jgi:2-oxoglutarate dehydrogenase E1 component
VGARWADLDPLKRMERDKIPELEPSFYGFNDADQETVFNTSNTFFGKESMSLRELMNALRETYCGTIGAEYMYTTDQNQKRWWQQKLESIRSKPQFNAEKKKHILDRLTAAEGLERFLHTKYVGQKRFSLEGGESFIACHGRADPASRCQRRARNCDWHGPPWPPECAGQHPGQDAGRFVCRV